MELQILHVPDCPHVKLLDQRLADTLANRGDVHLVHRVVDTIDHAAATGMTGSPTLLIDGNDPFAEPGQTPSLSCRLYRDERADLAGAPSTSQLRHASQATHRAATN